MIDYRVLDLELRLKESEAKCRDKERLIQELLEALQDYERWYRSVKRDGRPRARRRVLPSGWRLLVVGPRYRKKLWQA
jgi:hypothetical protein